MFTLASGRMYTAVIITTVSSLGKKRKKCQHLTDMYSRFEEQFLFIIAPLLHKLSGIPG